MVIYTTQKQHRQNPQHTVWQNMIKSNILALLRQDVRAKHRITRTALIFRQAIPQIFLRHWIFRMSFRPYIPQELYSMHSLEKNFRIGKRQQRWYERSHRTTNCRIIRFLQPIRSAKSMVILQASILPVLTVEKKQRFTAGSPVITVRSRTGMMERHRNTKIVNYMRSVLLN